MQIKRVSAHFLISLGNYSNERIGFSVALDEGETPEDVVPLLRERVKNIVGETAQQLYDNRNDLRQECRQLESRLDLLRAEWDATSTFLKAQGLNPDSPSMPQFRKLLTSVTVKSEAVFEDEDEDEDDEDDYHEDEE